MVWYSQYRCCFVVGLSRDSKFGTLKGKLYSGVKNKWLLTFRGNTNKFAHSHTAHCMLATAACCIRHTASISSKKQRKWLSNYSKQHVRHSHKWKMIAAYIQKSDLHLIIIKIFLHSPSSGQTTFSWFLLSSVTSISEFGNCWFKTYTEILAAHILRNVKMWLICGTFLSPLQCNQHCCMLSCAPGITCTCRGPLKSFNNFFFMQCPTGKYPGILDGTVQYSAAVMVPSHPCTHSLTVHASTHASYG